MNSADTDLLRIKRDALLNKKRVIDAIEKLRQNGPKNAVKFITDYTYFTEATRIHKWQQIKNLLDSIQSENIAYFEIHELRGRPRGKYEFNVTIGENFNQLASKVRQEYHDLNNKLGDSPPQFKSDVKQSQLSQKINISGNVGQLNAGEVYKPVASTDQSIKTEKLKWWERTVWQIIMIIGAIAGIVGLLLYFLVKK